MNLLNVENLSKRFGLTTEDVVHNISFSVDMGQILAILGPSGCGKTTTLRLLAGLEKPDTGLIQLANRDITDLPPQQRHIGLVFQDYALFPHLTVLENVMFGLQDMPIKERQQRARIVLTIVELGNYENRMPHTLSGGQQQRVALARSLAPRPNIILLDEPFSNLDSKLRESAREEVRRVLKETYMSVILVTHDQEEALSFADKIAVMNNGEIEQIGTPEEIYLQPQTRFVAEFIGATNLLTGTAQGDHIETVIGKIAINKKHHGQAMAILRPEHISLHADESGNTSNGKIIRREFKGSHWLFHVDVNDHILYVTCHCDCTLQEGDAVVLKESRAAHLIDSKYSLPSL